MKNLFQILRAALVRENPYEDAVFDEQNPQHFTILQIGDTSVRVAIVEVQDSQVEVLSIGRRPQNSAHMLDGIVTDISGIIANCNEALLDAERAVNGLIAPSTIIGITGELVKGGSATVSKQRSRPTKAITQKELEALIVRAQQKLLKDAKERIAAETGYPNMDVRLIQGTIIGVNVDGQSVSNPIGLQGRHFSLTLFGAFAPLIQLGAYETVAQGLDLTLIAVVPEPYALARSLSTNSDGIFIVIGESSTDIALVRQGGIEETRMFALGGRKFTRAIATSKGVSLKEAAQLRLSYSNGEIDSTNRDAIQALLAPLCQTWMDSVGLLIEELSKGALLPPTIYILSEEATLPDLLQRLENFLWTEKLPFSRMPIIRTILPEMIQGVIDNKMIVREEDLILMALAYQAAEVLEEGNLLEQSLNKAIQTFEDANSVAGPNFNETAVAELQLTPPISHTFQRPIPANNDPKRITRSKSDSNYADELQVPQTPPALKRPQSARRPVTNPKYSGKPVMNSINAKQPGPGHPLRVFLCHASDDKPAVRELYRRLKIDGFNPWLDEKKLIPGQDWQIEISKAVRTSDAVIVCLSHKSIQKTGYVQKEIKYALDVADEQLEGAIFIIPLKLEECKVPDRIARWQWVNFFEATSYQRLVFALRKRAKDISLLNGEA